jgi:hypothetical protein
MRGYFIVASRSDELLRLACLPFLRPKLARAFAVSSFPIRLSLCATARSKHCHSKCGDKMLRCYLYEAANVLLTRVAKWSAVPNV